MAKTGTPTSARQNIQEFGRYLSGMVMPNIGAFIAWGLITAFFIPTGWTPNESFASMVGPMITYLLPLLIAFTGGKMVGGVRGGVMGAIATMGVIVGADVPMFLGAMLMGPLAGWVIKQFDKAVEGKIKAGFEMLVNNFSIGIIGMLMAMLGYMGVGPVIVALTNALAAGVDMIVKAGLLPLVSLFVEPAKILFMNNALNHGVLGPIGLEQAQAAGKSIMFLIETNPGPGLGILLAYWMFSKGSIKESAPGAIIIHFLGGIHEIYFPYVLMNPALLLAVIAGGATGVLTNVITGAGLVATPSPGSIIALAAMAPRGGLIPVLLGVATATAVSFVVAAFFVKRSAAKLSDEPAETVKAAKGSAPVKALEVKAGTIVFACDAGMGSSAMGATTLQSRLNKAGISMKVKHCAIEEIPENAEIVVTQVSLTDRARARAPMAHHVSINNFMNASEYDALIEELKATK